LLTTSKRSSTDTSPLAAVPALPERNVSMIAAVNTDGSGSATVPPPA